MIDIRATPTDELQLPINQLTTEETPTSELVGIGPSVSNGNGSSHVNIAPPPGIEGMPPLSGAVVAGFASAAKGVTTAQEVKDEGGNKEGLLVLNNASA